MEDAINQHLKEIYGVLRENSPANISLMDGKAGIALFNFTYLQYYAACSQHNKNADLSQQEFSDQRVEYLSNSVQELAEGVIGEVHPGFCNGKTGVNWLFAYLFKKDVLTAEDWQFLCEEDGGLEGIALEMIEKGNFDFLYGALGIAWYLLYTGKDYALFFQNLFQLLEVLENKSATKNIIPHFDPWQNQPVPDQVNLGLSHGITSILKFCLQCYAQNVCTAKARSLAERIIDYLVNHAHTGEVISYFPNYIYESGTDAEQTPSRLAWCYGDLGIAYILYQSGILLNKEEITKFALEVLTHSTRRIADQETMVKDAGICHGSAGIAHMYNKLWHSTHQAVFKMACDFWMQRTLDMATYTDGMAGHKKYTGTEGVFESTPALLDGIAGIGLVLLSYLTGDFSWDYCLMLNN
jgi:lantibiotic biosynthesis protein